MARFLRYRAYECDFDPASANNARPKSGLDRSDRPVNIRLVCGGWGGSAPAECQAGCKEIIRSWRLGQAGSVLPPVTL
jgi:hypothetical protein